MELLPDTRLRVEPGNYEAGASYKFSCPVNYELIGPRYADIFTAQLYMIHTSQLC